MILPGKIHKQAQVVARENPDAIVSVLAVNGTYFFMSPSIKTILGYSPEEVIGHSFREFYGPHDIRHLSLVIQDTLLHGQSVEATRSVRLKSGEYKTMRGAGRRLVDDDTGTPYILSVSRPC